LGLARPEVRKAGWEILKEAVMYQPGQSESFESRLSFRDVD